MEYKWICPCCLKKQKTFEEAEYCYYHHTQQEKDNPVFARKIK